MCLLIFFFLISYHVILDLARIARLKGFGILTEHERCHQCQLAGLPKCQVKPQDLKKFTIYVNNLVNQPHKRFIRPSGSICQGCKNKKGTFCHFAYSIQKLGVDYIIDH